MKNFMSKTGEVFTKVWLVLKDFMLKTWLYTKKFFNTILESLESLVSPEFGAKAHKCTRRLSKIMLWVGVPLVTIILIALGGHTYIVDEAHQWLPQSSFIKVATYTAWIYGSITVAMHFAWLFFSKWDFENNKEGK